LDEEVKVVYLEKRQEGEHERAIRGRLKEETDDFIIIERDDGEYKIFKRVITRIEKPKHMARTDESDCKDADFDGESYR